jgi:hypothetical protein
MGFLDDWKLWHTSDEFDQLKREMVRDPAFGSWLAALAWREIVEKTGSLDAADPIWAQDPNHLKTVLCWERRFDILCQAGKPSRRPPGGTAHEEDF